MSERYSDDKRALPIATGSAHATRIDRLPRLRDSTGSARRSGRVWTCYCPQPPRLGA